MGESEVPGKSDLRLWAETQLRSDPLRHSQETQAVDPSSLHHELDLHRVELDAQCEELRCQQEELERSLQRYCELYESIPIPYFTVDLRGTILDVNPAGLEFATEARADLIGRRLTLMMRLADRPSFVDLCRGVVTSHERRFCIVRMRPLHCCCELDRVGAEPDTVSWRWVLCTGSPVLSPEEQDTQLRVALTDITEQKQIEIHLETQGQELRMSYQLQEQAHAKLLEARNDERRRLARELHDDQCQQLSVLILKTSALERQADPLLAKQLRLLRAEQTRVLGSLRDVSHGLHAEIDGVRILRRLIRRHAIKIKRRMAIPIELQLGRFENGLSAEGCTCLFRIVQEGLHNIIRHAEASHVVIDLNKDEERITLCLSDNGKGFNPNSVETAHGLGLLGMEERLDRLKGQLLIESLPGGGTRLTAILPVSDPLVMR